MSDEDAKAFITQVVPLGTMDYSLLHKRPPVINTKYGFSLPVPLVTLGIGIVGNNTINSWSGTWLLCISDGKNLQLGSWDYKKGN